MAKNSEETKVDNIDELKERAKELGISIQGNQSAETLKARINEVEKAVKADQKDAEEYQKEILAKTKTTKDKETPGQRKARKRKEATRLVRVQIQCLNPAKKAWPGEVFTVANNFIGAVRKYIPFQNTENGYHIPEAIYRNLLQRKYRTTRKVKSARGIDVKENVMVPEFQIILLPKLTKEDLDKLAAEQRAAAGL